MSPQLSLSAPFPPSFSMPFPGFQPGFNPPPQVSGPASQAVQLRDLFGPNGKSPRVGRKSSNTVKGALWPESMPVE
eukprot:scaffold307752_cov18-Tisochrysis_lutea.AAC.1